MEQGICDVWVEECSVAGCAQGQAGLESRALEGQGRTEQWSLKERIKGLKGCKKGTVAAKKLHNQRRRRREANLMSRGCAG